MYSARAQLSGFSSILRILIIAIFLVSAIHAAPGDVDTTFKGALEKLPAGSVQEVLLQPDGKLLVVGSFKVINNLGRSGIVRFNQDGSLDSGFYPPDLRNFNGGNLTISAIALQSDGKILLGGDFIRAQSLVREGAVRLNTDGTLDPSFNQNGTLTGTVYDIKVQADNKIFLAGSFVHSSFRNNLVRLLANGATDDSFFAGNVGDVNDLMIQTDGKIVFVGGRNSPILPRLDRLNADGSDDPTFATNSIGGGGIFRIKRQNDGKILVGGDFNGVNGFSQINYLARFDQNGNFDTTFNTNGAGPDARVYGIDVFSTGKIIIGGGFLNYNSNARTRVALLNSDGTIDTGFNYTDVSEDIFAVNVTPSGDILVGRAAVDRFGIGRNSALLKIDTQGSVDPNFSPVFGINGAVYRTRIQPDGKIIAVGGFLHANGEQRVNIARFNPNGTLDTGFNPMVFTTLPSNDFGPVALQPDGKILIGTVRLNADGTPDSTFSTTASGRDINVQPDGKIIYGGSSLVRTNSDGSIDTSFSVVTDSLIYKSLTQPDGKILVCGRFTLINGILRGSIARLNSNGSLDSSFNPPGGANQYVYNIDLQPDGKIILAGGFTALNFDSTKKFVGRLNPDGSLDTTFNGAPNFSVAGLKILSDGKIMIGGNFTAVNGTPQNYYARLNSDGSLDAAFNTGIGANGPVWEFDQQANGEILIGGVFSQINGRSAVGLARLSNAPARTAFDFDGDSKTDISIFRPAVGEWWYLRSSDLGNRAFQFGTASDQIVPADYTGDGRTDIAFWRESTGEWFIIRSEDNSFFSFPFGTSGDIPAPGDFDGDGRADQAVFRPSNATWYIVRSSGGTTIAQFGAVGDRPVVGDYDGDGKSDIAIFRPSDGSWWLNRSTAGLVVYNFGTGTDKTVQADYTGDGKTDVAFFRSGEWFVLRSENTSFYSFPFGTSGDIPTAGDYDGDGRADPAVFRNSDTTWYLLGSTSGFSAVGFGLSGDRPVPNAFVR